ncbi:choice-of-anchor L domain-containing protein [Aurantibacter sp.]|uniref:T9SS type B sorting domain-containing protein n=1 Tax=Aurantibacter sp. TaxID=2807103 RepID=UPI0035C79547
MKGLLKFILFFYSVIFYSQNIVTDQQTYTPQELIEDILIDSNCITDVVVTNAVSGNFGNTEKSFGYFDANGSNFPFQSGIVLSTGKLNNVQGPNTTLSDDDGTNWIGDSDLEIALQESGTLNATILEFDFTSIANQISFRYIFASEEYQENNSSTCNFSDLFGFLIKPVGSSNYENIALVPETNTPVKVTTVHPEIPNGCEAQNEIYFESFNGNNAPINFNGQTKVLTATANTIPNQTYHVKLVIADEQNYRYDSAVFLEAGSFKLTTDLGPDKLLSNLTALCGTETLTVNATQSNAISYQWKKNGADLLGQINPEYTITDQGFYEVEVTLNSTCISTGEITIEYADLPIVNNATLEQCDQNQDGFTTYNLFNAENEIITHTDDLIFDFYNSELAALSQTSPIPNPNAFSNTNINQEVYAVIGNQRTNCTSIAKLTLTISNNTLNILPLNSCDDEIIDGVTSFDLNEIGSQIQTQIPTNVIVTYYTSEANALASTNSIPTNFINTTPNTQLIYVRVDTSTNNCFSIGSTFLNTLERPEVESDYTINYCINNFPETITLNGGVLNPEPTDIYSWTFNNNPLPTETSSTIEINTIGTYTFIVTNTNNCQISQVINVNSVETPVISNINFTELSGNNSVTIETLNSGDFEYAIDNPSIIYQNSNTFTSVSPGFHTIYVREKNGCGLTSQSISILGVPKFFTPNGDGFNDYWKPIGISDTVNFDLDIKIFNRYGKLLKQLSPKSRGWDGKFNNAYLPTEDYWFIITGQNGLTTTGHFTLKR